SEVEPHRVQGPVAIDLGRECVAAAQRENAGATRVRGCSVKRSGVCVWNEQKTRLEEQHIGKGHLPCDVSRSRTRLNACALDDVRSKRDSPDVADEGSKETQWCLAFQADLDFRQAW